MILSGELEARVVQDILDHEGCLLWPYCDVKGLVTIGVGHLLPTSGSLLRLDCYIEPTGRPASLPAKQEAWTEVKNAYERGKGALAYKGLTNVRITRDLALDLCKGRLDNEFMPAISRVFPEIASWPFDAIRAVVDIAYNCGAHCFDKGWVNFVDACRHMHWVSAADHCTRADARRKPTAKDPEGLGPRNLWTIDRFRAAADLDEAQRA
jgi:GH24 family phage-related lysozyme (muramidase)